MRIIIRHAGIKDAREILDLQKLCYKSEAAIYNLCRVPPMDQTLDEIEEEFKSYLILKILIPFPNSLAMIRGAKADRDVVPTGTPEGKRIIGSVRAKPRGKSVYIGRLIVHPDLQNRGIGTRMIKEIESRFPKARRFWLMTGEKSQRNIYLYRKLGYKIFKKKQVPGEPITFVYLERKIDE
jgi:ribosomal protein S18 acetylase RimI-like enzyme